MKKNLLIALLSLFTYTIQAQEYIDVTVRLDDYWAQLSSEIGDEEATWHTYFTIGGNTSSTKHVYHASPGADYSGGAWYNQSLNYFPVVKILNNNDDLVIHLEGWEEDKTLGGVWDYQNYDSNDDNHSTGTESDVSISDNTRGEYVAACGGAVDVGGTNSYYKIETYVKWNYTIPIVSCNLTNVSYGSIDINMTGGNYRVTSWDYEVSDDASFSNIVSNASTSSSSTTATGLTPLTQYWVRIKGSNEGGIGSFSGTQTTTTPDAVTEPSGDGTEGNPYQIADITNLNWLVQTSSAWDKYFIQTADIDASGTSAWNDEKGISLIGNATTSFTGEYNGDGFIISDLGNNSSLGQNAGLFGIVSEGKIKNLGLVNANYTGSTNTGLLLGRMQNQATVINCNSSGSVDGHQKVGGLVGSMGTNSHVSNSFSTATVSGSSECGGLIGMTYVASVSNSFALGDATADGTYGNTGGLIGYFHNNSSMINCYSTGNPTVANGNIGGLVGQKGNPVSAINSFWDLETSGQATSDVGTSKTTTEMKTQSTFTDASWDFSTPIWSIDGVTNNGYPNLENNLLTYLWVGNTDSDWNTASNWNLGSIPSSSDAVYIPQSQNNPLVGSSADCSSLTIYSGATLTIAAGGSLIPTGIITNNGTFNMQHSMNDGEWHFVSSPVAGATANLFYGDYLQYYDETLPENNYVDIDNENMALSACKGYAWRNFNKGDFTFTGDPNHGDQSISTTAVQTDGWNLVGNPYPSSIDWNMLDDTYGAVYLWTGTDNEFSTYIDGATTNGGNRYIAPMQGFLISTDASGTFSVSNSNRTHSGADGYVKTQKSLSNYVKLKIESEIKTDEVFIQFNESYLQGFDLKSDAWKMLTTNPDHINIYAKSIDGNQSIDRRPECENIQLGVKSEKAKWLSISIIESVDIIDIQLEDTKLNLFHELSKGAYGFNWETSDSEERFILHLKATGTEEMEVQEAQVYAYDGQIYIRQTSSILFQSINIFDLAGRVIYAGNLNQDEIQSINLSNSKGAYLVQLIGENGTQTEKIIIK